MKELYSVAPAVLALVTVCTLRPMLFKNTRPLRPREWIWLGVCILLALLMLAYWLIIGFRENAHNTSTSTYTLQDDHASVLWLGVWALGDYWTNSSLTISKVTEKNFDFDINAVEGGDVGEITGVANFSSLQSEAIAKIVVEDDDRSVCNLTFNKNDSTITIRASDNCSYFGGAGVDFNGEYVKNVIFSNPTVANLKALQTPDEQNDFSTLVGTDLKLFLDSSMIQGNVKVLDKFPAIAVASGVDHLYTISENIIMTTTDGKIWAAAIDTDGKTIKYFTNVTMDKETPPQTIQDWIDYLGYTVVYQP